MIEKVQINKTLMSEFTNKLEKGMPFYFNNVTSDYGNDDEEKRWSKKSNFDTPQMVHTLYQNLQPTSESFDTFIKVFKELDCIDNDVISIFRMKINLNFPNIKKDKKLHHRIHNDIGRFDIDKLDNFHKSLILYLNDSDGDTIFFDDNNNEIDRVSPKKGLALIFDSTINHAGQNPINCTHRYVLNSIFIPYSLKRELLTLRRKK